MRETATMQVQKKAGSDGENKILGLDAVDSRYLCSSSYEVNAHDYISHRRKSANSHIWVCLHWHVKFTTERKSWAYTAPAQPSWIALHLRIVRSFSSPIEEVRCSLYDS